MRGGEKAWSDAAARCPKTMAYGPCAGVGADDACEVPGFGTCTFVDVPVEAWPYDTLVAPDLLPHRAPLVIADLPATALSATSLRAVAAELTGAADACLIGDHSGARVQFPPSYRVRLLAEVGVPAWAGINCRDRNRVALEGEVAACVDAGALGLHCVTGDHTTLGSRPDTAPVFDLDAVELVALAAGRGIACSVAHAPVAPPTGVRLPRLLSKIRAGADTVFVDHSGGPDVVAAAVAALRATGFAGAIVVCVPFVLDEASAQVLLSFAAGRIPAGYVEGILSATDRRRAGIDAATALAGQLLAIPGVDGVNLSGGPQPGAEVATAAALAEIAMNIRADRPVRV